MARRNDHSREEISIMALKAAHELISQENIQNFSVRKIAKEIGYSASTIYNIFGDHNQFLLSVNYITLSDMYNFIIENIKQSKSNSPDVQNNTELLCKLASSYIEYAKTHYNSWNALFEFHFPGNQQLPKWYSEKITALFTIIEDIIYPLIKHGSNDENRKYAKHSAKLLWASIHGICQLGITGKLDIIDTSYMDVLTESLIRNYLAGVNV